LCRLTGEPAPPLVMSIYKENLRSLFFKTGSETLISL